MAPATASAMQQWLVALRYEFELCLERREDRSKEYEYYSTDEEVEGDDVNDNEESKHSPKKPKHRRRSDSAATESRRRSSTVNIANYFVQGNAEGNSLQKGKNRASSFTPEVTEEKDKDSKSEKMFKKRSNSSNSDANDDVMISVLRKDNLSTVSHSRNKTFNAFRQVTERQSTQNLSRKTISNRSILKKRSADDKTLPFSCRIADYRRFKSIKKSLRKLKGECQEADTYIFEKELLENELTKEFYSEWINAIEPLVEKSVASVVPRTQNKDWLSILPYVKIKLIPGGNISSCSYVDGLVFRKMIAHRGMNSRIESPRILLLKGALIYQPLHLTSFQALKLQEEHYMALQVQKIADLRPTVVMVGGAVSRERWKCCWKSALHCYKMLKNPR